MSACPELAEFEERASSPSLEAHLAACESCRFVRELLDDRSDELLRCERFEALLAARADGALGPAAQSVLDHHLAACEACRVVADTLAPAADAMGDHATLPEVDPTSYELGLEVARGGMGRILAARDLRVGRPVAVKELLGRSSRLAARFEREARVTARLQHPGIVPIYEIGRWPDGTPFYSMRMVDGRTLREAIEKAPELVARIELLPAVIAAAEAVAFAHARRIIHRDLTPSNVLVGAYGETVVIDWGLAKDLAVAGEDASAPASTDCGGQPGLTSFGAVIGTAAYMPPEQADAQTVDERADVYALGAILYHVLAGEPPYRAQGSENLLDAVKAGPPRPVEAVARGAPRDLVSIVAKAMARDPDDRYPSARELVEELRRFHTGRMVEAHAYTPIDRVRRFVVRHRGAVIVTMAAALLLTTFMVLALRRVLVASTHARHTARTLLEDRGRTEMLAGRPLKAFAHLAAAYDDGARSPALAFLLAGALREIEDVEATLDCGDDVRYSEISPDGRFLAAACRSVGRIWRLSDYSLVHTLGPARDGFDTIRYSHDGKTLASIGRDGVARLYDASTGTLRASLVHRAGKTLKRVMFTPDDRRLVTTGSDGDAAVWDLATRARLRTISAGTLGFLSVYGVLSPDGKTLLTVTAGGTGTGWDLDTGEEIGRIDHGAQILGGQLSPDGTLAVTCGVDRRIKVWNLATRDVRWSLPGHSDVVWKCVFSADGSRLLTASNDGTAKVWDLTRGEMITSVAAGDVVWHGELSRSGERLLTVSLDGSVKVWDATTGALLTSHVFGGRAAHFISDGDRLVMERADGKLRIWRRPGGAQRHKLVPPSGADVVDVSPDGTRAVLVRGTAVELWDVVAGRRLDHAAIAEPVASSRDGRRLVARGSDGVLVIDTADGRTVTRLPVADPRQLALDRGAAHVVVSKDGEPSTVWSVSRQTIVARLAGTTHATMSDDGRVILGWGDAIPPTLWRVDVPGSSRPLADLHGPIAPVGFSRDGERVVISIGSDATGRVLGVWNTRDGTKVLERRVAGEAADLDPGGTLLTLIGVDGVVEIVRLRDGATVASFVDDRLARAQVNAAGTLVVGMDRRDATVSVLDAVDGRLIAQWPVLHSGLATTSDSFVLAGGAARWTDDGAAIVARSGDLTVWDATSTPPDPARVARARRDVPWRIVDGRLHWIRAALRGRVTRDGTPVARAVVTVTMRERPPLAAEYSWSSTAERPHHRSVVTAADGTFAIQGLAPGEYAVVAQSEHPARRSSVVASTIRDLDQSVELSVDRDAGLSGVVRDRSGAPLAGARVNAVCLTEPADHASTSTAADGRYALQVSGDCRYAVDVEGATPGSQGWPQVQVGTSHVTGVDVGVASRAH